MKFFFFDCSFIRESDFCRVWVFRGSKAPMVGSPAAQTTPVSHIYVVLSAWVRPWALASDPDLGHKLACRHFCFKHVICFGKTCRLTPLRAQVREKRLWWCYNSWSAPWMMSDLSAGVCLVGEGDEWRTDLSVAPWRGLCALLLSSHLLLSSEVAEFNIQEEVKGSVSVLKLASIRIKSRA